MAFCNPKAELSALLCNIPSNWRDSIVRALTCILSLRRDGDSFCNGVKDCETLTHFEPITVVGNTITFKYRDEKGVLYSRSVDITTVINNILNDVDASCLMDQEDWAELTFTERLSAIYAKTCCVHGNCGADGGTGSGCGCEDCGDDVSGPCVGLNACACVQYTVSGTPPFTFSYKDCTTKLLTDYESIEDNSVSICALKNSLVLPDGLFSEEIGNCGDTTTTTSTTSTSTTSTSSTTTSSTTTTTSTSTTTTTTFPVFTTTTTTSSTTTTTTILPPPPTTTTTSTSTTTTTTSEAPILFVKLSNTLETICSQPDTPVYTSTGVITPGLIAYYDAAMSVPVIGFDYIQDTYNSSAVYNMNSLTGLIGANTGQSC